MRRKPLPGQIPRPLKTGARGRSLGRPAHIRVTGVDLSPEDRDYVRRRLGMKLGKFSPSIERITLRLSDVNGPRGGVDRIGRTKVVLSGLPSIVVERRHHDTRAAVDAALEATERAVRRVVQRRRALPRRIRPRRTGATRVRPVAQRAR